MLHDIGKIGVSEAILRKIEPLSDEEFAEVQRHPIIGTQVLQSMRFADLVSPIVRGHHERWEGKGYPDGLAGETIPLGARIVSLIDAYDAMTSDRSYRRALTLEDALTELVTRGMFIDVGYVHG
jgi:putative two-component system response regulator